ncbi:uncharacterized protein PHACADRAFT_247203 [Phanerochaete carnosa HHB-10118-sp]|uniref:Uncharacterized protein n=1 Tax=Phanerochaete carnosa (strain HHB-10118-sp) TaxID=650164 RepID=K5WAJ7_PHACS|nr:uncharacterized protein PHACADRAFT_247203 [Phanerochaete carnosa HHB-10118-sp]EKM60958.1 hypothetical protein PHACADRAFT_247203 [Phanerochaete carnosa HHB-10118-sp]
MTATSELISSTTLAFMGMDSPLNGTSYAGFLPINADSSATNSKASFMRLLITWISGFILLIEFRP